MKEKEDEKKLEHEELNFLEMENIEGGINGCGISNGQCTGDDAGCGIANGKCNIHIPTIPADK